MQTLRVTFAALALTVLAAAPARAQDRDPDAGRRITIMVGYSAGGGYDHYARTLARHFGRHLPGHPPVMVQNMPGAATLTVVRYLDVTAPKDGTVIAMFDPALVIRSMNVDAVKHALARVRWLGAILRDTRICYAWAATGIRTFDDLMARREFVIGTTAKGSNAYVNGAILQRILGAPVRQIAGYPGSNEERLAVERGELDGGCGSWSALPPDWIAGHRINPLVSFSQRRPDDMPAGIPYAGDLVRDAAQMQVLALLNAAGELARPLVVAREVPAARVAALRAALAATLADADFLADARRQALPLDPVGGEEAERIADAIDAAAPDLARRVRDVLE
jgi:tripartite-type tricarboxylate transporter receptor subunit TctC